MEESLGIIYWHSKVLYLAKPYPTIFYALSYYLSSSVLHPKVGILLITL